MFYVCVRAEAARRRLARKAVKRKGKSSNMDTGEEYYERALAARQRREARKQAEKEAREEEEFIAARVEARISWAMEKQAKEEEEIRQLLAKQEEEYRASLTEKQEVQPYTELNRCSFTLDSYLEHIAVYTA